MIGCLVMRRWGETDSFAARRKSFYVRHYIIQLSNYINIKFYE